MDDAHKENIYFEIRTAKSRHFRQSGIVRSAEPQNIQQFIINNKLSNQLAILIK